MDAAAGYGDHFIIDDLLNFSNDDTSFVPADTSANSPTVNHTSAAQPHFFPTPHDPHFSAQQLYNDPVRNFSPNLYTIPP